MLAIDNTIIDETVKPAIEWINGRPVQKLMPTDLHGILQLAFAKVIEAWAQRYESKSGKVITEWRFIIPPNSYKTESLVPDVADLSTYFDLPESDRTYPRIPPDIAVEILSPGDDASEVDSRRKFFLWWGVRLILIADPEQRTVEYHESEEYFGKLSENDTLTSLAFPTLSVPLKPIFAELDEPT
jgi:Uma2 family endonuclease